MILADIRQLSFRWIGCCWNWPNDAKKTRERHWQHER